MAGFWSGVWKAITGRGSGDLPVAQPPAPDSPVDVTEPGNEPPNGPPIYPDDTSIDPAIQYWMDQGANRQEAETLVILEQRFDSYPSIQNWRAFAEAQEEITHREPDWAYFREKYEGLLA